jgi:ribosomal protein S24E
MIYLFTLPNKISHVRLTFRFVLQRTSFSVLISNVETKTGSQCGLEIVQIYKDGAAMSVCEPDLFCSYVHEAR